MIDKLTSTGQGAPILPTPPVRPAASAQAAAPSAPAQESQPAAGGVPADVLHSLDAAQRVLADMHAHEIDLRYVVDHQTKKVRAQLVGPDGEVLREIPARHALDLLAGDHVVDALA
jgi:hypothetical protein